MDEDPSQQEFYYLEALQTSDVENETSISKS